MITDNIGSSYFRSNFIEAGNWDAPIGPLHLGNGRTDIRVPRREKTVLARDPRRLQFPTDAKCVLSDSQIFRGAVAANGDHPAAKFIKTVHTLDD